MCPRKEQTSCVIFLVLEFEAAAQGHWLDFPLPETSSCNLPQVSYFTGSLNLVSCLSITPLYQGVLTHNYQCCPLSSRYIYEPYP